MDSHVSLHLRGFLEHLVADSTSVARCSLAAASATQSRAARCASSLVNHQVFIQLAGQLEALEAQLGKNRYKLLGTNQ